MHPFLLALTAIAIFVLWNVMVPAVIKALEMAVGRVGENGQ